MLLRTRQPLLVFLRQQSPPALLAHCRTPPLPPPPTPLPLLQRILTSCCPPPLHNAMSTSPPPAPTATHTNRLADERSPYLLQHAHNPVDWYPWGQEAFSRAVAEDKLIFLSIGYSTCHWCHVMEKESFENVAIADILRKDYIAIKLDREERPDIDKVYQNFVAKTTGLAGWPLTVVLTPTREPIIGGTYFPPEDKFGHMGLKTYVEAIAKQWKAKRALLSQEAKSSLAKLQTDITKHLNRESPMPDEMALTTCFQQMHSRYKRDHGGFSDKPKFPQESMMNFLLALQERRGAHTAEGGGALEMVAHTLLRMGYGGIHDHVAAGFARYSVDERWHVPHFEKMLYDQAQLGVLYVDAHVAVGDEPLFGALAEDILLYVRRELTHALGGFYGAQDADSLPSADAAHKKEGAFCVWEMGELQALLTDAKDLELFCHHFGVKSEGNVNPRMDPHNELKHKNVLCCFGTYEETAKKFGLSVEQTKENLRKSLEILRIARLQRPKPSTDTKIITAWNGLMLAAYARAGFAFKKQEHIDVAIKAANFIKQWLTASDGSLLRCCYGVEDNIEQVDVPIPGLLVDYAYLIRGLLHLYTATLDGAWLAWAEQLQDIQNTKFWDPKDGSYFQIQEGDEFAIMRDKDDYDGAEPSGTSVAVHNLIHLEHYLERKDYREKAEQIFKSYSTLLRYSPISLPEMTAALIQFNHSPHQIFIAGERGAPDTEALIDVVRKEFMCGAVLVIADGAEGKSSLLYQRHKSLENIHALHGKATAYMCREFACSLPVTNPEDLRVLLRDRHKRRAE